MEERTSQALEYGAEVKTLEEAAPARKDPSPVRLLTPVAQTGRVDVSDLASLPMPALHDPLVGRAGELVPLLERSASVGEADRRVADENIKAIRAAGLFKIMVPRRFGGPETDIRTKLDVSRELARGDGATA